MCLSVHVYQETDKYFIKIEYAFQVLKTHVHIDLFHCTKSFMLE